MDDKSKSSLKADSQQSTVVSSSGASSRTQLASKTALQPSQERVRRDEEDFNLMDDDDDDNYDDEDEDDDDQDQYDDDNFMDDDDDLITSNENECDIKPAMSRTDAVLIDSKNPSSSLPNNLTSLMPKYKSLSSSHRSSSNMLMANKRKNDLDEEFKYEILTPEKIVQDMVESIREVNQIIQLPPTTARILLHHFRWDKEKLMERFYDGNQERLFKEAHIVNPFKSNSQKVIQLAIGRLCCILFFFCCWPIIFCCKICYVFI